MLFSWAVWRIAPSGAAELITCYSLIITQIIVCVYNYEAAYLGGNGHFFVGLCLGGSAGFPGTLLSFFAVVGLGQQADDLLGGCVDRMQRRGEHFGSNFVGGQIELALRLHAEVRKDGIGN